MPHKHKRRDKDDSIYDLPPSVIAKPLPVRDPNAKPNHKNKFKNKNKPTPSTTSTSTKNATTSKPGESRRKPGANDDDTPKAFRRLMQLHAQRTAPTTTSTTPEDEPTTTPKSNKKRKRDATERPISQKKAAAAQAIAAVAAQSQPADSKTAIPKILPGEKLSDFAARVDREMPMSAMKRSERVDTAGLPKIRETRQTKHEKHLRRLQKQWREEEKEILEREAAEREEREGEMEEELRLWNQWEMEAGQGKAKKKGAGKRKKGADLLDADPWAKLNREKAKATKPANPLEVVQAPPELKKPREIFKVRGGAKVDVANVPAAGGSLRQREELATERKNIVEQYRKMMAEKRGAQ